MTTSTLNLYEELQLIENVPDKLEQKTLFQPLQVSDSIRKRSDKRIYGSLGVQDQVKKKNKRTLTQNLSISSLPYTYKGKKHQTFEVIIYRNGSSLNVQKENVLEFDLSKSLSDEVGGGYILFENADLLDYREGDQIEIKWQSESATLPVRIFRGEIDKAEKEWDEEKTQQNLRLSFQDWAKILLEQKITTSYPTVTSINTIIEEILEDVTTANDPPYINERKISLSQVSSFTTTRTIDFIGESLFDCLKKLAFISRCEFYVDKDKRLQFFQRPTGSPVMSIEMSDILDYNYEERDDLIMNTVQVYGHQNKPYPTNFDELTESTLHWEGLYGSTLSAVSTPPPALGEYLIKIPISGTMPVSEDWYQKYEGYVFTQCFPGQGMNIVFSIIPPPDKYIEFNRAQVTHSGSSECQMAYQWGTTAGAWINFGTSVKNETAWREAGPITGALDQILYIRWHTGAPSFWTCCTISGFAMEYRFLPFQDTEEKFGARLILPTPIDLSREESFTELSFYFLASLANYSFGGSLPVFQISLHFSDGDSSTYQGQFTGLPMFGWTEINIPLGENAEGWDSVPNKIVTAVDFDFTVTTNAWSATDYLGIDGFHFDKGKWYDVWSDSDSMESPPDGNGIKYKKLFDDTLYSDVAALRWAKEHVLRYAEPLYFLNNVDTVANGIEYLEPGDIVSISIPETPGKTYFYRIIGMHFKYNEDEFLTSDITFERTNNYQ